MTITAEQAPTVEQGYALAGDGYWDQLMSEHVHELRWPFNLRIYAKMQTDAQVQSVLQAVIAPILRTTWSLDGRFVDNIIATTTASSFGLPLYGEKPTADNQDQTVVRGRDRFSWNQHLVEVLDFLPMGHSIFNPVYRWDHDLNLWRLRKLGFRPAQTISKFNIADDGGLVSIEQHPRGSAGSGIITSRGLRNKAIEVDDLVAYAHGRKGANWRGVSVLRACYKNWLLKDDGNRTWAIALLRNGVGLPVHKAGPPTTPADVQGEIDRGLAIARRVSAGSTAGVSLRDGASLELLGVKGTTVDPDKFVRYQDEQIARAVLAHFLNLGTQTGSWALGSTFADFFTLSLQAIAEEIRDIATNHIVEDLVDANFGFTAPAPRIVFDEIGSRRRALQSLDELRKQAGLEDDEDMAEFIREKTAIPEAA